MHHSIAHNAVMDEQTTNRILKTIEASSLWKFGLIVLCAFVLIVVVKNILPWLSKRLEGHKRVYVLMLIPFLRIFIITGAVVLSVPLFIEPSFQNMIAILGSVGLALGFALKDYASSLIAGIIVVGERNYRNGDWVTIEGIYGMVKNTGLRTVEIVTPDDNRVLIPHKLVWNKPVSNANDSRPRLQCIRLLSASGPRWRNCSQNIVRCCHDQPLFTFGLPD